VVLAGESAEDRAPGGQPESWAALSVSSFRPTNAPDSSSPRRQAGLFDQSAGGGEASHVADIAGSLEGAASTST
jgi:hypothetical protein